MGYLHINNLYKSKEILAFKTCYALEKIHGTSAHISWKDGKLEFFSGGESHAKFVGIFDIEVLTQAFMAKFGEAEKVTVFGEAYGGKQQGMSPTYGPNLKFVAFDVRLNEQWLNVRYAEAICKELGIEFVDYIEILTDMASIDGARDLPSTQAVRNGILEPKLREGVVLRPPFEVITDKGERIIAKHKRAEFAERSMPKVELDSAKHKVLEEADQIAQEWATHMRLEHIIDHIIAEREDKEVSLRDVPVVIAAMLEDVEREGAGEVELDKPTRKAIGSKTVMLFKARLASAEA